MSESSVHPLESVLRLVASASPQPWYPSAYSKETNTPRETVDPYLDQLRMAGLVRLTDWVSGHGQGYALTPAGVEILRSPRQLARLAAGKWSPPVDRGENRQGRAETTHWDRGEAVRAVFSHPIPPWVTYGLVIANVFVFLIGVALARREGVRVESFLTGSTDEIMEATGGVTALDLLHNQWWRLITSCFVHGGLLHLGANMLSLFMLGRLGEQMWGRVRYLVLYLVAGLGGNCLALMINPAILDQGRISIILLVGASGAICGLLGSEAAWIFLNRQHLPPWLVSSFLRNVVINVLIIAYIGNVIPNVSNLGHLGGGVVGASTAVLLNYQRFGTRRQAWMGLVGVLFVPVLCIALLVRTMNSGPAWRELRKAVDTVAEAKKSKIETQEFEENWLPRVQSSTKEARQIQVKVDDLIEQRPKRRNSKQVDEGIAGLTTTIGSLNEVAAALSRVGPYATPLAEKARTVGLKNVEARLELLRLLKECLVKGEMWTKKDENRKERQTEESDKAEKEWQLLLK